MKNTKKSHYLFILTILLLLFSPAASWPQNDAGGTEPSLSAFLDRDSAPVGSIVNLTLAYHLPEGAKLPEEMEIVGLEDLTVIESYRTDNRIIFRILVDRLDSWKTGPLSLSYLNKDGETNTLAADPVSLTVISNLGEKPAEAQLRPIQGIIPLKPLWFKYLPWAGGIIALALLGFILVWWYKKGRKKRISIDRDDPPHIRAMKEMEELESRGFFEKGHFKEFYFRFSEILRYYLEDLRGFPAAEYTTEEIAHHLKKEGDRKLLPLLRQADMVKFADAVPTPAGKEEEVKMALSYIRETGPSPDAATETAISKGAAS